MSRMSTPGIVVSRPTNNVYTGMAFISFLVTLLALIYVVAKFMNMGVFS